jgi:GT2 family glycosyltransferase
MDLSVIIVNHNTKELLADCLRSIFDLTRDIDYEVIVVDNHSDDGSPEMVQDKFVATKLIASPQNIGFSRANNLGYRHSCGEHLLFLNSDTLVSDKALSAMVRYLRNHPEVGVVGPKILSPHRQPTRSFQRFLGVSALFLGAKFFSPIVDVKKYQLNYPHDDFSSVRPVDWVSGACMVIKKTIFEKAGRWDETYFFYYEDMDLCYQVYKQGYQTVYYPEAEIVHLFGQSTAQSPLDLSRIRTQSMKYYFKKNFSRLHYYLACFYLAILKMKN